jgi:hypothetical protein
MLAVLKFAVNILREAGTKFLDESTGSISGMGL